MSSVPSAEQIEDLVDANHILHDQGIVDGFGHVSVRDAADAGRFLLARNMAPARVQAADILEYDVATGEALRAEPPRLYLERYIHSEIYRARPDVMAVVHNHSPAVLPFCIARGARLRPVCHMAGFLGGRHAPAVRDPRSRGASERPVDSQPRTRRRAGAHAGRLSRGADARPRLHRGRRFAAGWRCSAPSTPKSTPGCCCRRCRWARSNALTPEEADATRTTNEGQAARPWELWREQARQARQEHGPAA